MSWGIDKFIRETKVVLYQGKFQVYIFFKPINESNSLLKNLRKETHLEVNKGICASHLNSIANPTLPFLSSFQSQSDPLFPRHKR